MWYARAANLFLLFCKSCISKWYFDNLLQTKRISKRGSVLKVINENKGKATAKAFQALCNHFIDIVFPPFCSILSKKRKFLSNTRILCYARQTCFFFDKNLNRKDRGISYVVFEFQKRFMSWQAILKFGISARLVQK